LKSLLDLRRSRWLTKGGWAELFAAAPREELEQAILRLVIGGVVVLVMATLRLSLAEPSDALVQGFWFVSGFVLFGFGIAVWLLARPEASPVRRFLGMIADNAGTSYFMLLTGEGGAIVFFIYIFVAFGNEVRFGRVYGLASQLLALAGFGLVMLVSDFWSAHRLVGLGIVLALICLPRYVGHLSAQLKRAKSRAEDANQAKDRFLANMSHEMRTPLNGVIAMADLLRETSLQGTQRELVQTLSTSAQLALAQIEDVLDMAKLQAGRVNIETLPFDFGKLLTDLVKVIVPQARYKRLAVNTEISPDAGRWFLGDAHHLRQVVLNLLSNAVKFTERGEIILRASTLHTVDGVSLLRVEVQDTGIGIDPAKKAAIFEPFAQADESITRVYGGTGLGTTIARQLVTLMGGQIGVESTVGVGSLFWFELPLQQSEPQGVDLVQELAAATRLSASAAEVRAGVAATVHKMRGARILVAEDNPTNQRVTELILESGGHVATIVSDGEAALDALEQGGFHLALFDMSMPGVSGLEALKLYRFSTPKPIPVVILSANVTTEAIAQCQTAGAAEFVAKPVRPSVLLDVIEKHLSGELMQTAVAPRSEERPPLAIVDTPVVDRLVLSDLSKLSSDPTFVDRLVAGFESDCDRLVGEIASALGARRYEAAKDAAHALKGGAGGVGATQLFQFAIRIEKATHDTLRLKAAQWTDELQRISARTRAMLDDHVSERQQGRSRTLQ